MAEQTRPLLRLTIGRYVISVTPRERLPQPEAFPPEPVFDPNAPAVVFPAAGRIGPFSRLRVGQILVGGSILCLFLAALNMIWTRDQVFFEVPYTGIRWAVLGVSLFLAALYLIRPQIRVAAIQPRAAPKKSPIRWEFVILGLVELGLFADANGRLFLANIDISQHMQVFLFFSGVLSITWGLGGFSDLSWGVFFNRSLIPLYLITLLALVLRVWELGTAVGIMIDEIHIFDAVAALWQNHNMPMLSWIDSQTPSPMFLPYFSSLTLLLTENSQHYFFGVRLVGALIGTLTIPAAYILGRSIFDHKMGLTAAFLLAVLPPAIHFSRLIFINIVDPVVGTLALAFLVRALRFNTQRDYVLAGVMFGLVNYFYEGGRLLFCAVFILFTLYALVRYRPFRHRRGIFIMLVAGLIVVAPYYYGMVRLGQSFASRLDNGAVRPYYLMQDLKVMPLHEVMLKHWTEAMQFTVYHTIYSPEPYYYFIYGGWSPILAWHLVPFYLLGLVIALFRLRSTGVLLWLWISGGILGISFCAAPAWTVRYQGLFPLMMLLVAIGMRYGLELVWQIWIPRRALFGVIAVAVAAMGIGQLHLYWGDHLTYYNRQIRQMTTYDFFNAWDLALDIAPPPSKVVFFSTYPIAEWIFDNALILRHRKNKTAYAIHKPDEVTDELLDSLTAEAPSTTLVFAVVPDDYTTITRLKIHYRRLEGPIFSPKWSIPSDMQYALYVYRPPHQVAATTRTSR